MSTLKRNRFLFEFLGIAAALAIVPALIRDQYFLHITITGLIFGIVASNWNLAIGYGGIFHLAQVPFFAAGGYASAILAVSMGITPWIGLLAAGGAAVVLSVIVGVPSLRVRGIYLVFLTFSSQFIMQSLILFFANITGGDPGLVLPPFSIANINIDIFNPVAMYYMTLLLYLFSLAFIKKVTDSDIGLALKSLRDSEVYAVSRGVNPYKYKMVTFLLSSFLAGVCGALYVHYLRVITPAVLDWSFLIMFLASIVTGGFGTLYGPLLGAFILTFASEALRALSLFRNVIFGTLMIVILIFLPKGLITIADRLLTAYRSRTR